MNSLHLHSSTLCKLCFSWKSQSQRKNGRDRACVSVFFVCLHAQCPCIVQRKTTCFSNLQVMHYSLCTPALSSLRISHTTSQHLVTIYYMSPYSLTLCHPVSHFSLACLHSSVIIGWWNIARITVCSDSSPKLFSRRCNSPTDGSVNRSIGTDPLVMTVCGWMTFIKSSRHFICSLNRQGEKLLTSWTLHLYLRQSFYYLFRLYDCPDYICCTYMLKHITVVQLHVLLCTVDHGYQTL